MLKLVVLSVLVAAASAAVSSSCLSAICQVESGCRPLGCSMDVGSIACGYYQIHWNYYLDCGTPDGKTTAGWHRCASDKSCADRCVRAYLARYGSRCTGGRTPQCEDYARIHNGGPAGCHISATVGYWHRVQGHLG